jgi:hypothetical protein
MAEEWYGQFPSLAADLVRLNGDVIVTGGVLAILRLLNGRRRRS